MSTDQQTELPEETDEQTDGPVETAEASEEEIGSTEVTVDLGALEALLFSTHHPLTAGRLAELLDLDATKYVKSAVRDLNKQYEDGNRSFRVEQVAGGYQMLTLPNFAAVIKKHQQKEADAKLTKAALETLAIISYKQPILRADVEAIRGVACGETIRSLMEKHLVKIAGRAEEPGRPILYGTTKRFLEVFGLNSLKDLPKPDDGQQLKLSAPAEAVSQEAVAAATTEQSEPATEAAAETSETQAPAEETKPDSE